MPEPVRGYNPQPIYGSRLPSHLIELTELFSEPMPIYEYECAACGHRKEAIQKISDEPLKDCPECGKPELKKMVSAAAFRLKGGGWYETDFKSGNKKNLADGGKGADSSKGGDAGGSSGGAAKGKSAAKSTSASKKGDG